MEEAEIEGAQGNVAAAQTAVQKADELTKERNDLKKEEEALEHERQRAMTMEEQLTAGNKQMQVCQVCGCFMLTNDAQSRIDDHLSGKLHIAYTRIKEQIDLMVKAKEEKKMMLEKERGRDKDDKDKSTLIVIARTIATKIVKGTEIGKNATPGGTAAGTRTEGVLAVREVAREMGGIDAPRTDGEVIDVIDVTEVGRETAGAADTSNSLHSVFGISISSLCLSRVVEESSAEHTEPIDLVFAHYFLSHY